MAFRRRKSGAGSGRLEWAPPAVLRQVRDALRGKAATAACRRTVMRLRWRGASLSARLHALARRVRVATGAGAATASATLRARVIGKRPLAARAWRRARCSMLSGHWAKRSASVAGRAHAGARATLTRLWRRAGTIVEPCWQRLGPMRRSAARVAAFGAGALAALVAGIVVGAATAPGSRAHGRGHLVGVAASGPFGPSSSLAGRGGPIPFEPDACVAFGPTGRANGRTVFLDPGHGGVDAGAISDAAGRTVMEKQVTLAIGVRALGILRTAGYRVVISRLADSTVARLGSSYLHDGALSPPGAEREIEARNLCANAAHADVLIALHEDSFVDPSASGSEAFYCPQRPFGAQSHRLASLLERAIVARLQGAGEHPLDRGVLPDSEAGGISLTPETANYDHLIELGPADRPWLPYPSSMPGVLVEPLFLSNPSEAAIAASPRGQAAIASAVLDAVDAYFGRSAVA